MALSQRGTRLTVLIYILEVLTRKKFRIISGYRLDIEWLKYGEPNVCEAIRCYWWWSRYRWAGNPINRASMHEDMVMMKLPHFVNY